MKYFYFKKSNFYGEYFCYFDLINLCLFFRGFIEVEYNIRYIWCYSGKNRIVLIGEVEKKIICIIERGVKLVIFKNFF